MIRTDVCAGCGGEFDQELRQGRPRTFCETCRPPKVISAPEKPRALRGLRADPPVRADGCCAVCSKPRKITKQSRKYAGVQVELDPFCSGRCCRKWHGCEISGDDATDAQIEAGQRAAAARSEWRRKAA